MRCIAPRKHYHVCICDQTNNKRYSTQLKTRVWIVSGKFFNKKTYLQAVSQKRQTVLAKLLLPHFIETAFVHSWHCRLFSQVQEIVLVNCAAHTLIFGLNCSGTVNHWFLVVSSFGSPNKVVSLSQRNTASPGHGAGGSNNTTATIKITPSFFAYTFGRCNANLPTQWRRHVGAFLNEPF